MRSQVGRLATVLLIGVAIHAESIGAEISYEVRAGSAHTDNLERDEFAIEDELVVIGGLALNIDYESNRVLFDLVSDVEHRIYTEELAEDETLASGLADFEFHFVPDTFSWMARQRVGQLLTDPFAADTPSNRENISRFTTGPDFKIRLGSRTSVDLNGRFRSNSFEIRPIDNETVGGGLGILRALNTNRILSLNSRFESVSYEDNVLNQDYERTSYYVGYTSRISRGDLEIRLGINEIDIDGLKTDSPLYLLELTRELSARTGLFFRFEQKFSDTGDQFARDQDVDRYISESQDIAGFGDTFESRHLQVRLDYNRGRNNFYFGAGIGDENYAGDNPQDRVISTVRLDYRFNVSRRWSFRAFANFRQSDFENAGRVDDDIDLAASLAFDASDRFSIDLGYLRADRQSTSASFNYVENRVMVTLRYGSL